MTPAQQITILVVDDEPPIRTMLQDVLETEGYHVLAADGAAAALQTLTRVRPALILVDLMMPGLDGRALAAQLARDPHTAPIPLVLMSAAYQPHPADRFAAVLVKPFDLDTLFATLSQILGQA